MEEPAKLALPLNDETLGQQDTARGLECGECGMVFSSPLGLNLHRIKHSKAKMKSGEITQLECKACGRRLSSMRGLKIHMAMHGKEQAGGREGASVEGGL